MESSPQNFPDKNSVNVGIIIMKVELAEFKGELSGRKKVGYKQAELA
jgi:hypothetical protein